MFKPTGPSRRPRRPRTPSPSATVFRFQRLMILSCAIPAMASHPEQPTGFTMFMACKLCGKTLMLITSSTTTLLPVALQLGMPVSALIRSEITRRMVTCHFQVILTARITLFPVLPLIVPQNPMSDFSVSQSVQRSSRTLASRMCML